MKKKKIFLTKGSGEGITPISAYCRALDDARLMNLNLIPLSSVLPHHCKIVKKKPDFSYIDYGKRLYVIISQARTSRNNTTIYAGLGWMLEKGGTGNGLVVEATAKNKAQLIRIINKSLNEIAGWSPHKYGKIEITFQKAICKNKPVCALAAFVFMVEDWK